MSIFNRIFEVFSKRPESSLKPVHDIPESTRNRILLWCNEVFSNTRSQYGTGDYRTKFWQQVHRFLQYRHGKVQLYRGAQTTTSTAEDAIAFLSTCKGEEFVDFIEYIFRVDCFFHVALPENQLIEELNDLLRQDNLPYHVTNFVKETVQETVGAPHSLAAKLL